MKKWLLLIACITSVTVLVSGCGLFGGGSGGLGPAGQVLVPYTDRSFTVEPLHYNTITINMAAGAVFEGYLSVTGGNNDVRFYIKDSYGNTVLDINRVKARYDFSYKATSEGFHTIYFSNTFSLFTSKQVNLHYRVR